MIKVTQRGSFKNVDPFLQRMKRGDYLLPLLKYGPIGVSALAAATPKDSSETANSWYWFTVQRPGYFAIHWSNSNMEDGISIAAIIQYGHGTKNGGYVRVRLHQPSYATYI